MAFDASVMKCFVKEAKELIINAKIDKIHQPQKEELLISIRTPAGNKKLFLSANPSYPRIHFTSDKGENPMSPPMFCMLLRKHIGGGRIIGISQEGFERILVMKIESYDELGDLTVKKLVVEIMGKHSNIILLNHDNKIMDSIKRIDISTSSVRQILPGLTYRFPPVQNKKNPMTADFSSVVLPDARDTEAALMAHFYGISKLMAREIAFRQQQTSLSQALEEVLGSVRDGNFSPLMISDEDGKPVDFNAVPVTVFDKNYMIETNPSISYIVEKFYYEKALHFRISQKTAQLVKLVTHNIERCRKKLAIFNQQLLDSAKRDQYKEWGDLITANLYQIHGNPEFIEVPNYFKEGMPLVKIKLDSQLSPSKNAQKYFTKYNKAKNAEAQAHIQIKNAEKELEYLESVLDFLQRIDKNSDIAEIKEELALEGYLAKEQTKRRKKESTPKPLEYQVDGYQVFVGKNNRQNDYLTLKIARSNDVWLHTKNIPGSHVIIVKQGGQEIPDKVILKAAKLAATHSKAHNSAKVPVDYTQVKNVKKPSGAKPGMVIYDHYNTVYVTP